MEYTEVDKHNLAEVVDTHVRYMDLFGIETAVLTPVEPNIPTSLYKEAAAIYPDRFFWACSIPPRPMDRADKKLSRYQDEGCIAIVLDESQYHPNDPAVDVLIQKAIQFDLPVFFRQDAVTSQTASFIDEVSRTHEKGNFVILKMGGIFGFHNVLPMIRRKNIWLEISVTLPRLVESPLRVFLDALIQDEGIRSLVYGSEHWSEYSNLSAAMNMIDLNIETNRAIRKQNAREIIGLFAY
ncbi:MAG: hypothetical protein R6V83_08195 [Candidatus Thorarchaeota archaeon]